MSVDNGEWVYPKNISLRDYFAAKAMEQLIAKVPYGEYVSEGSIAIDAYDYADAMLERRK